MNPIPLADTATIKPVADCLRAGGAAANRYLDSVNVSPEMVERGGAKITKRQVYRFLALASRREGIPDLGYRFGEGYFQGAMGGIAQAVMQAATLRDAVLVFDRLLRHWMAENRSWLEPDGSDVWLCNAADDGFQLQRDASTQCCILVLVDLVRLAAGPDWMPKRVRLEMKPSRTHERVGVLSEAEVRFDPEVTAVAFPAGLLARAIRSDLPVEPGKAVPDELPEGLVPSLYVLLRDQLAHGLIPCLEMSADLAGVSPRSFQRHLRDAGLTYRSLIDRVRFEIAHDMLRDPTVSIGDISASLGYSGLNNFIRAFRRVSGMTPTEYKSAMKDGSIGV